MPNVREKKNKMLKHKRAIFVLLLLVISLYNCGSPKNIVVGIEAPLQVTNGDEFIIVCTGKNSASKQQTLVSIDIADDYIDGIAILRTEPDNEESFHVPIDNTMSYVFKLPIEAGEHLEIKLHAKAVKQGDYNGYIDSCINSDISFKQIYSNNCGIDC